MMVVFIAHHVLFREAINAYVLCVSKSFLYQKMKHDTDCCHLGLLCSHKNKAFKRSQQLKLMSTIKNCPRGLVFKLGFWGTSCVWLTSWLANPLSYPLLTFLEQDASFTLLLSPLSWETFSLIYPVCSMWRRKGYEDIYDRTLQVPEGLKYGRREAFVLKHL